MIESIPRDFVKLESITKSVSEGIHSGKDEVFFLGPETITEYSLEEDLLKPVLKGKDIKKYLPPKTGLKVIYPYKNDEVIPKNQLQNDYPNTWSYLKENEGKLREREYVLDSGKEWYELWCERKEEIYENPKILLPEIADSNKFTLDTGDNEYFFNTKVKSIRTTQENHIKTLLGVLNSKLLEFMYRGIAPPKRGGFRAYKSGFLYELRVPRDSQSRIHDLVDEMLNLKSEYSNLNLSVLDYLGISTDDGISDSIGGETLGDLYMPPAGLADSPLSKTAEDYEGLRVEDVHFESDGARLVMHAEVSYKPDEDDPRETDNWGRLAEDEFESYEAMVFTGLSDAEETLVREFVPVAVDEAGGFADFRQSAKQTISLVDRLEDLTLPDVDATRDGLERYMEVKNRADELDEKIEKTDTLIDEIVYDLYGLTDEEIEIVEEAVAD